MSLTKWVLTHKPSEKDPNRWLLKLKIDERELLPLVNTISGTVGRPFLLEKDEYDFGFYIYEAKESEVSALTDNLNSKCPDGKVEQKAGDDPLGSLLDKVATGISGIPSADDGSQAPAVKQPENEPPASAESKSPEVKPAADPRAETAAPDVPPKKTQDANVLNVPANIVYSGSDGKSGFLDLELNPKYTFEDFIIGPNNRFTAAAAQAVADNPGKIYNPFFIYGGVGLGKTHMMHAVGHYVRKKTNLRVLYVTTEKFMGEVIDSIRRGALQQMRDHYREVDLLLVDDIQFLVESESTQEEFFHTFNVLHQNGKQIIITSDRPPKHLTTLEDRLRSRFEWGLIADIKSPNLETRVAILKKKGENEKLKLDDNILLYIASKLKSNIRELEGFLKRINAYASLVHQDVNMDLVHSLMADLLPKEEIEEAQVHQATQSRTEAAPSLQSPFPPVQTPTAAEPVQPAAPIPEKKQAEPDIAAVQAAKPALPLEPVPTAPKPPLPKPAAPVPKPVVESSESNLKSVDVAFFYPEGKDEELVKVKEHFRDVIKKHKLKFRLEGIFERTYAYQGKINYGFFSELCKTNNVGIAVVLGPPMDSAVESEDFGNLLSTVMDDEKLSLQLIPWTELNKDYRYLNLALDITLLKHKL